MLVILSGDIDRHSVPHVRLKVLDRRGGHGEREEAADPGVIQPQRLEQDRRNDLALAIEVRPQRAAFRVEHNLQPSTELRQDVPLVLIRVLLGEIHAGGTSELVDERVLGPVDDERPAVGHHREVPDVQFALLEKFAFLKEPHRDSQRLGVREILVLALRLRVPRLAEVRLDELHHESVLAVPLDRRHVGEGACDSLLYELAERTPHISEEIGRGKDLLNPSVDLRSRYSIFSPCKERPALRRRAP
ncbi:MAG: hypothetical protein NTU88_08825 [Armatimonadetes bacterium]|nr:hypothetical protein [Armatimonadota bacterium]